MDEFFLLQGVPDAADAAVHHVRRSDDVHAGRCLNERLLLEYGERVVVEDGGRGDRSVRPAVIGIGIERDIGHDAELGKRFFSIPTTRGISPSGFVASLPSGFLSDGSNGREERHHRPHRASDIARPPQ